MYWSGLALSNGQSPRRGELRVVLGAYPPPSMAARSPSSLTGLSSALGSQILSAEQSRDPCDDRGATSAVPTPTVHGWFATVIHARPCIDAASRRAALTSSMVTLT